MMSMGAKPICKIRTVVMLRGDSEMVEHSREAFNIRMERVKERKWPLYLQECYYCVVRPNFGSFHGFMWQPEWKSHWHSLLCSCCDWHSSILHLTVAVAR